jgi:hypothetical protein
MSKLLENQRIVHIVSEFVILISLIYYFNQKHKKLLSYIEDLVQRVEEQEDILQKHDQILKSLVSQQLQKPVIQQPQVIQTQSSTNMPPKKIINTKKISQNNTKKVIKEEPKIQEIEQYDEQTNEVESNLDAELTSELNELNEEDEIEEVNLKKK